MPETPEDLQRPQPLRVDPADEGAHPPEPGEPLWSESHYMDAISDDGTVGVYARLGDTANLDVSMMSFAITRPGLPSIILNDTAAPPPTRDEFRFTVEAPTYTASFEVTDPVKAYVVTFEGAAYEYADEGAILRGEPGTPTHVKADLTWLTDGIDYQWSITTRYEMPCRVTGTLTIDGEEFQFAGDGQRDHSWATRDWWGATWMWNAFRLDDGEGLTTGTKIHSVVMDGMEYAFGYVQKGEDLTELSRGASNAEYDGDGRIANARIRLEDVDLEFTVTPTAYANLLLTSEEGKVAHFVRAMADFAASDGRTGRGWIEWERVID
ncbi:hypothetical protein [Dietzia sp. ANT_WB102]|uniref:DUF7064 domain-containing protein n=1 Tax=Dietzia sp. ANT_WB102 TaxID=2597345 RepID=UPI0011EE0445|nr:hypothetical protein [Dietzia sp. ANT_WB102]KAA0918016.1 hypothetical protein FQ137_01010 [Dietzia sp. ANT_WB102]